jgi:hypothetical protein
MRKASAARSSLLEWLMNKRGIDPPAAVLGD